MRPTLLLLALTTVACSGRDRDGDGSPAADDCNDNNDAVFPGAAEQCDGVDNNCDGQVDEGVAITFYLDSDGDTYGDPDTTQAACEPPAGFVDNADDCNDNDENFQPGAPETCDDPNDYNCDGSVGYEDADGDGVAACEDCDDADPNQYPGNAEVCDGQDNDCDDLVDADTNPTDALTWYFDGDSDGYGTPAHSINACEPPFGYADNADDCNDSTELANPGMDEVCDDLDNDCDGTVDGPDSSDAIELYVDDDGDGFGDGAPVFGCEGGSGFADADGDCDDADLDVNPGADEVCNDGIDNDCDGGSTGCTILADDAAVALTGELAQDFAGYAMLGDADLDNDGDADLLVSATQLDTYASQEGGVYVYYGPLTAGAASLGTADAVLLGADSGSQTGNRLASVGDLDDDGIDDVVVSAHRANHDRTAAGSVYVLFGGGARLAGDVDLAATADHEFEGERGFAWLGAGVLGAGDLTGDGVADLIVGANGDDSNGRDAGTLVLFAGGSDVGAWVTDMDDAAAVWTGDTASHFAGGLLGSSGDMDGDGLVDFAVGVPSAEAFGAYTGALYVVSGADFAGIGELGDATAILTGDAAGDRLGTAVAGAGDIDGDGLQDLWAGASRVDTSATDAGAVFLVPGATDLTPYDTLSVSGLAAMTILGGSADDGLGASLAGDADFDGDAAPDLLVGVAAAGDGDEGATWLFLSPTTGTLTAGTDHDAVVVGDGLEDGIGSFVGFGGDLLTTGRPAALVGSWTDDINGTNSGGAFVFDDLGL